MYPEIMIIPEIITAREDILSNLQKDIFKQYYDKEASDEKINKFILNVMDKKRYILHIFALKFYLEHGLKLKKVHRTINFNQSNFLKPYIEFNTEKRKNAKSEFEKDLFKLMNYAVYGKIMENVKKHLDFKLDNSPKIFLKLVNKLTYKHRFIINENLIGIK